MGKEIENSIGYYIVKIAQDRRQWLNNRLEQHGITLSQIGVLNCLWNKDGLTQKEIQKTLDIKPSSLTALIDILVEKEIVIRREDENDARGDKTILIIPAFFLKNTLMIRIHFWSKNSSKITNIRQENLVDIFILMSYDGIIYERC